MKRAGGWSGTVRGTSGTFSLFGSVPGLAPPGQEEAGGDEAAAGRGEGGAGQAGGKKKRRRGGRGEECPKERAALLALYQALCGDDWVRNDGWGDASVPIAEWFGVTVASEAGKVQGSAVESALSSVTSAHVIRLNLTDNNLKGRLVAAVPHLEALPNSKSSGSAGINDRASPAIACLVSAAVDQT